MINLKYILLLGIMLVNLIPYLKDGNMKWKSAFAMGQNYFDEYGISINETDESPWVRETTPNLASYTDTYQID